jgi:hypothetical protein
VASLYKSGLQLVRWILRPYRGFRLSNGIANGSSPLIFSVVSPEIKTDNTLQTNIAVVPIKSGVATLFVAMAEDPEALHENFPDLYESIVRTYPQVRWGIQREEV